MNANLKNPVTITVTLVVISLLAGAFYYFSQKDPESVQEIAETDEFTDWPVYQSQKYGFRVKYPVNWQVEPGPLPNITIFKPAGSETPNSGLINLIIEEAAETNYPPQDDGWVKTNLDGQEAFRYDSASPVEEVEGVRGPFAYKTLKVKMENKGVVYTLSLTTSAEVDQKPEIFEHIVSTFEFLE